MDEDYVTLSGSEDYYIMKTSVTDPPSVTIRYPNGGESISNGTQVQVSAHATDDAAVTCVTFYYSRDGGSNWTLIGDDVKVSGTDKDGAWNRTWNTEGLSAGMNYMIKAVASDGTSTSEDQSDGTFSLRSSNVIYVPDDYLTILAAVDAASPGSTIIVRDGTYIENVDVNKRLTIKSENSAENCIVQAANSNDHVFEVTADYVTISGFTVKQVRSPSGYASGIVLGTVKDCEISGNNINFSSHGIALVDSKNNIIKNNIVRHTGTGISLRDSSNCNMVKNNTLEMNNYGISLYNLQYDIGSDENTITCNKITSNLYGIELRQSNSNLIYLNDLNANNAHSTESTNLWNSPSKITYSYNGNTYTNYLGNYWYDYRGSDANGDGIGDTPYSIDSQRDKYPLMEPFEIEN
jgi:parallel beta-helix repeat protein